MTAVGAVGRFGAYDLVIRSPLRLPGFVAYAGADGGAPRDPDIAIRLAPPAAMAPAPVYARSGGGLAFSAPGVARYRIDRRRIAITPDPDAMPDDIAALAIATALPALLWLRGDIVLHAAAVVPPGRSGALLIAGPSGSGKSTVARLLLADGAALLADDSVRLARVDGEVVASGLAGGTHSATRSGEGRRFVPAARTCARAGVAAILILSGDRGAAGFTPLRGIAAVEQLLLHRHRPRVPALLGRQHAVLAACAVLAAAAPVVLWRRGAEALADGERAMLAGLGQAP